MSNINFILKIKHTITEVEKSYNVGEMEYFDSKATGVEYSVKNGSQAKGILTGTGFPKAGKKITLTLPIFTDTTDGILEKISEWNRYLLNSVNYRFYLSTQFGTKIYEAEIVPENGVSISTDFKLITKKSVPLTFVLVDNFYTNDEVIDHELVTTPFAGVIDSVYTSETFVVTPLGFTATVTGQGSFTFRLSLRGGFGIHVTHFFTSGGVHQLLYDQQNFYVDEQSIPYDGKLLQLEFGDSQFRIQSSLSCSSCIINYFPKVAI